MMKILSNVIDTDKVFQIQNNQYNEVLLMSGTIAANFQQIFKVSVSSNGHFYCLFVTGTYTTLKNNAGAAQDDAVSHLRGKMIDGGSNRPLFNDFIPLDLWLTPGRRKDSSDLTGAASNNLYLPIPFEYLFMANTDILLDVKNDSDFANEFEIAFFGIRCRAKEFYGKR